MSANELKFQAPLYLARDLCLKLLERRQIGPEQLPSTLTMLNLAAKNLFKEFGEKTWPLALAKDFTAKMIERNLLTSPQATAVALGENTRLFIALAATLPEDQAQPALSVAKDLVLKMLETGRISQAGAPELLAGLSQAALALNLAGE